MQKRALAGQRRLEFIKVLKLVFLEVLSVRQAAKALDVNRTTLWRWGQELLTDGQEDTDDLRALAGRSDKRKHR